MADPLRVAIGGVQALGPAGEALQVTLEALQFGDPLADLRRSALEQLDDVSARGLAAFA